MTTRADAHRWELLRNSPIKVPVRAATTANGTLASAFEAGDVVDGVTLVTGDRILVKDQTAGAQNGIYDVQPVGAPLRSFDMDVAAEVVGTIVFVVEGTANGGKVFKNTNTGAITLETTALTFDEVTGSGAPTTADYLVGTAQADLSAEIVVGTTPGGELGGTWASPTVDSSHSGSTHAATQAAAEATAASALATHEADTTSVHGIADTSTLYRAGGTDVAVADGGTGASSASAARTNLGISAANTPITDTGSYYTGTDVEGALQEIGAGGIGGGGGSAITVQDEGSSLATAATTINFVGAGVTASGTGATKTITVPGGSGATATDTAAWMPLTSVVGGVPELVWDADDSLVPTFVPL